MMSTVIPRRRIKTGKGRVRGHMMWLTHLSRILKRSTIESTSSNSRGIVGLDAKAIGPRPALASLESVVGLSLKHAPSPVLRFKEKRTADTRPRAPHDNSSVNQSISQSVNQSISQSVNQSISQSVSQSLIRLRTIGNRRRVEVQTRDGATAVLWSRPCKRFGCSMMLGWQGQVGNQFLKSGGRVSRVEMCSLEAESRRSAIGLLDNISRMSGREGAQIGSELWRREQRDRRYGVDEGGRFSKHSTRAKQKVAKSFSRADAIGLLSETDPHWTGARSREVQRSGRCVHKKNHNLDIEQDHNHFAQLSGRPSSIAQRNSPIHFNITVWAFATLQRFLEHW